MLSRADRLGRAVRDHPVVIEARAGHRCDGGVHSYLGDGRVVCWDVPAPDAGRRGTDPDGWLGVAVDAEIRGHTPSPHVVARWGLETTAPEQFWEMWCATEVLAKLADVPMVLLARQGPVISGPVRRGQLEVHWVARHVGDVVVAHGMAWATTTRDVT
ncbi:hypothetical protein [Terrabacter sp. Ter38]|uniref:hypothetical protein n=1 Tax=Terrabacter sp. Ter38 TaxID=2926030 RepID=UPI002117C768|nr:hypothetical protein [Terrabacter sp. Ter38]